MRTILAFALALITVLFAFVNQNAMDIKLGPYEIHGSVAVILIGTFIFGIITGIVATLPSSYKRRKMLRTLSD
jgi:uncharacterized integral membrane protein